jgi:hypothetical protein
MSSSQKSDLEKDFAAAIYLSAEPPLPYKLYTYIYPYLYLFTQGGRRVEPERRGEGQQGRVQITKLGRKYQHDFMYIRN